MLWLLCLGFVKRLAAILSAMFRRVAIALVAMAAFDLFFLDGQYIHALQEIGRSILHFSGHSAASVSGLIHFSAA